MHLFKCIKNRTKQGATAGLSLFAIVLSVAEVACIIQPQSFDEGLKYSFYSLLFTPTLAIIGTAIGFGEGLAEDCKEMVGMRPAQGNK